MTSVRTGVWVVARDLRTPESVQELIRFVQDHGLKVVIAQVVVGGYAYYPSQILPRTEYHQDTPDFDPLQTLIDSLKPQGVEIHAWINTLLYWSRDSLPKDSMHVCNQHPDWFMRDDELKPLIEYTGEDRTMKGIDGMFLDPTRPEIRDFVARVYQEVASQYDVDFVHLDFVRYPGNRFGFTADRDRTMEVTGVDPLLIDPASRAYAPRWHTAQTLDVLDRWYRSKYMVWNAERAAAITQLVQQISRAIQPYGVKLSGAVFPNPGSAYHILAQDWRTWQENGSLQVPVPMAYTRFPKRFEEYADALKERLAKGPVYLGIGVWLEHAENYVPKEIRTAVQQGFDTLIFFDYGNLKNNNRLIRRLQRMHVLQ